MDNRIVAIEQYWVNIIKDEQQKVEFDQIAIAENPEFNKLGECLQRILQEAFINDATEYGVSRWEKMLNIYPQKGDTLEDRKVRVLTYLNLRLPYTWRVLKNMIISFVGENNFTMKYFNDIAKLVIRVKVKNESQYYTIATLLKNVVPQNVVVDLGYME